MAEQRKQRRARPRVMAASIGGVIYPGTAWKIRILARELGLTLDKTAELACNHLGLELGISFEEIPNPEPLWIMSRIEGDARADWKKLGEPQRSPESEEPESPQRSE